MKQNKTPTNQKKIQPNHQTPSDFADRSTLPLFFSRSLLYYFIYYSFFFLFLSLSLLYGIYNKKIRKRKIKSTAAHKPSPYLSAHSFSTFFNQLFPSTFLCYVVFNFVFPTLSEYSRSLSLVSPFLFVFDMRGD